MLTQPRTVYRWPRTLAVAGMAGTVIGAALVALLHVMPPSAELSPVRRTISEYALLETGWVFNLAVLLLAAAAVATFAALVGAGVVPLASGASAALLVYCASLPMVVLFPKHNWAVGPSIDGDLHRAASVVAFVSLPVAVLLLARPWLAGPHWRTQASASSALGVLTLLCFSPIVLAILAEPYTGVRWWRAISLGAVERALAISEVATVLVLGWWAAAAGRRPPAGPPTTPHDA